MKNKELQRISEYSKELNKSNPKVLKNAWKNPGNNNQSESDMVHLYGNKFGGFIIFKKFIFKDW